MHDNLASVRSRILETLRAHNGKARFITELGALLKRSHVSKEELEQGITHLAAEGAIVVRDNFCADPHLENVDLRIAALVEDRTEGYAAALHEIDLAWNKWLGEFLANHRCG